MNIYIYVYVFICRHVIYIHICVCVYTYVYKDRYMYELCVYIYIYIYIFIYTYVWIFVHVNKCIHVYHGINVDQHSKPRNKCKYSVLYLHLFRGFECWSTLIPRWDLYINLTNILQAQIIYDKKHVCMNMNICIHMCCIFYQIIILMCICVYVYVNLLMCMYILIWLYV
jgi:hypothetical protein